MKIQSISRQYNEGRLGYPILSNNIGVVKGDNLSCQNHASKPISQENYIAYLPNFTSSTKRTYSSENKKLQEKSGDFKIAHFSDVPCPACGKKMINQGKYLRISAELEAAPPEQYLEILGKYKDYMRPVEESVYNEIYELSQKPGASKDIRTLLVSLRNQKLPVLQKVQMRQVKKMKALSKTLPTDERITLQGKIGKLKQYIRKTNSEAPFRRKILIDRISKIKIRNPRQYQKLQNIANNFPTSADMNSAWIVKYSGKNKHNEDWDSLSIAKRFLYSSVANTDHILAYSIENNHDDISNYIAMHNACNSQKSDKPFMQWICEDKNNRLKYLQDYFDAAGELTDEKIKTKKYRHYVAYATETIREATKGQVDIKDNTKRTQTEKELEIEQEAEQDFQNMEEAASD